MLVARILVCGGTEDPGRAHWEAGVCLVLALYRDNAVAHLRSMVEEARDVAEGSVTAAALASPFGRSGASSTSVVRSWGLCVDSTDGVL